MLREKENQEQLFYNFSLENYIPEDHLLRLIDKFIDFSFIIKKVKHLYSHTGRPSIDPVVLIKMLLIGYLYDIKSERQIEKEIQVNLAYRWFLKYNLEERIPDHSTISQTRRRKFSESGIFQEIFDEIVMQIKSRGLINGDTIFTDSTHIRANASFDSVRKIVVTPTEYLEQLEQEVQKEDSTDNDKDSSPKNKEKYNNKTHRSKTDPDAKLMNRSGKPRGLHYLEHRSVDLSGYITDTFVTGGNEPDSMPYIKRLLRQKWRFNFRIKNAVADRGYGTGKVYAGLTNMGINAYIPKQQKEKEKEGMFTHKDYLYVKDSDYYICPAGNKLNSQSRKPNEKHCYTYGGQIKYCNSTCIYREKCIKSKNKNRPKRLKRHMHQNEIDFQLQKKGTTNWRALLKKRKYLIEGSFADAKVNHGPGRAKLRGINNVQEQTLLIATVQNIKKFIKDLRNINKKAEAIYKINRFLLNFEV